MFASTPKLLGDPLTMAMFDVIGFGQWFLYLTGACELAGLRRVQPGDEVF